MEVRTAFQRMAVLSYVLPRVLPAQRTVQAPKFFDNFFKQFAVFLELGVEQCRVTFFLGIGQILFLPKESMFEVAGHVEDAVRDSPAVHGYMRYRTKLIKL